MLRTLSYLFAAVCLVQSNVSFAVLPVKVEPVIAAPLQAEVKVHATLFGKRDVDLAVGTSGLLAHIVTPGDYVKKGQLLAKLDTRTLEIELKQHQEMWSRAKTNFAFYDQELERLISLAKTNVAAKSQVAQMQNQRDLAASDIRLAEIKVDQIKDTLSRASVFAPFDGVVSQRMRMANSEVNRTDLLLRLIDIHQLEARVYVPIKYLNAFSLGQNIIISSSNEYNQHRVAATIDSIIPATDPRSQTFEVRAALNQQSHDTQSKWASGQLVDVTIPLLNQPVALLVNHDALILRQHGVHVVKILSDNTAKKVSVSVGKGNGQLVEIRPLDEGELVAGEIVAIRGAERLNDGQKVEIQ
ncbi:efflux transporter, RND family, MFP subunit,AcrA/E family [Pseudoalteromonas luteoviolacea B = ATCC 29581]|nr:efflux transporter, RND family, MFP subunit,AcrA/E family [Pseudoalteromonas luteoviolacea B = ATCC 29581]